MVPLVLMVPVVVLFPGGGAARRHQQPRLPSGADRRWRHGQRLCHPATTAAGLHRSHGNQGTRQLTG